MKRGLLIILFLLITSQVQAATYWVNQSASGQHCTNSGSDPGTGGSSQTIQQGISCMSGGDTLMINEGTYELAVGRSPSIPGGSSWSNLTTVRGVSGAQVIVRGIEYNNPYVSVGHMKVDGLYNTQGDYGGIRFNDIHVRTDTVEFTGAKNDGFTSGAPATADIEILNSYVHDIGIRPNGVRTCDYATGENGCNPSNENCLGLCHGTYMDGSDFRFSGNRFEHCEGYGFHNACSNCRYEGNTFVNNGSFGIIFRYGSNSTAVNNVFRNNNGGGILMAGSGHTAYNNTFYGNQGSGGVYCQGNSYPIQNNIFANNSSPITECGGTFSANLCNTNDTGCTLVRADVGLAGAGSGDFHLKSDSPAIGQAQCLALVPTDLEGHTRNSNGSCDIGAYEFVASDEPPNPQPGTIIAKYSFETGTGTSVPDDQGGDNTGTFTPNGARVSPGAVGSQAGSFDGTRYVQVTNTTGMKNTEAQAISAWVKLTGTGSNGCEIATLGDAFMPRVLPNGNIEGTVYDGNWDSTISNGINALNNLWHHVVLSYDRAFLRVYFDNANVATLAKTTPISHTLGPNFFIGNHGNGDTNNRCTGLIDEVYVLNGYCDAACVNNFFTEQVPIANTALIHSQFAKHGFAQTEANLIGTPDSPLASLIGDPLDLLVTITRNGAQTVLYYGLECSRNGGAFTAVGTTLGTLGAAIATNSLLNMGDSTPVPLPALLAVGGATPVAGRVVCDTPDTNVKTTLNDGQYTQWRYSLRFGAPMVNDDTLVCRAQNVDTSPGVITLTLKSPPSERPLKGMQFRGVTLN